MAKAIEQTPVLKGKEAIRFLDIISDVEAAQLTKHEKEVIRMVQNIPARLKIV